MTMSVIFCRLYRKVFLKNEIHCIVQNIYNNIDIFSTFSFSNITLLLFQFRDYCLMRLLFFTYNLLDCTYFFERSIEDTKVSVSIKRNYAKQCILSEIFISEILKRFSAIHSRL